MCKDTFVDRQGGDEFAVVLKANRAPYANLYSFYNGWKTEINALVRAEFMSEYKLDKSALEKGKATLKERQTQKVFAALQGVEIDQNTKDTIAKAIQNTEYTFGIDKIGISVGLFINSGGLTQEQNWIKCAEMAQEAAKNMPGKNEIRIYYEGNGGGILPAEKTKICLEKGCYEGLQ